MALCALVLWSSLLLLSNLLSCCLLVKDCNADDRNSSNNMWKRFLASVTSFAEISPLLQNFKSLWQFFDRIFLIWQNDEPTLANLEHYWANFRFSLLLMAKYWKIFQPVGHTVFVEREIQSQTLLLVTFNHRLEHYWNEIFLFSIVQTLKIAPAGFSRFFLQ